MKVRVPNYFNEFKCIASKCEDTCCAGWEIVIDDESYKRYENVKGKFKDELKGKIVKSDGDNIFLLNKGNCSFLNDEKMCDIYINLGEEYLCHTCKQYPRYTEVFLDLKEIGLSLSCKEAARIILKDPKNTTFNLSSVDEENNNSLEDCGIYEDVLLDFLECRETIFSLIKRCGDDLGLGASLALEFVGEVQNKIDLGDMDEIKDLIEEYKDEIFIKKLTEKIKCFKVDKSRKHKNICKYLKVYKNIKHINSKDPLNLNKALEYFEENEEFYIRGHKEFNEYYKDNLYKFKNILIYFIFRYFMKAIFDYDVSAKIKLSIISTLIIRELSLVRFIEKGNNFTKEDIVEISHMYSKDIEHSDENIESLQEIFETEEIFDKLELLHILMEDF